MEKTIARVWLGFVGVAALAGGLAAQTAAKVGVLDSQRVLETSVEGKRAIAQLEARNKQLQADVAKLAEQIKGLETRLSTQRLTLTVEAAQALNADLARKQTEHKRVSEDATRELQELQFKLLNKIQAELIPLIEALGKEKGLDVIFDLAKSGAVYFNPAADLTNELIRRYDAAKAAPPAK